MAAQTKAELLSIYNKLNRLTSLPYPEYKRDLKFNDLGKFQWWGGYENDTITKNQKSRLFLKMFLWDP